MHTTPEKHPHFVTWATEPDKHGARYSVRQEAPGYGLTWALHDSNGKIIRESGGAFYNDVPEHPEGAVEWCKTGARAHAEKMKRR